MQRNPFYNLVITYEGADYALDLNRLTKREEILLAKKTGLTRAEFMQGWATDDPEATLFGVWLALKRALGDEAPAFDDVDVETFGDWVKFADDAAVQEWLAEQSDESDPTPAPAEPTPNS